MFSCEFCEISKNTFFTEHFWMAASGNKSLVLSSSCQIYSLVWFALQVSSWQKVYYSSDLSSMTFFKCLCLRYTWIFFVSALVTSFTQYVLGKVLALRFGNPGTSLHFVSVLSFAGNSIIDFQWNPEINRERTRCSKSYNWINFLPRFGKVSSLVSFLW